MITKFHSWKRYRHRKCLDIDVDVIGVLGCADGCMSLVVKYWNRFYKIYQGSHEVVHVKTKDMKNWNEVPIT